MPAHSDMPELLGVVPGPGLLFGLILVAAIIGGFAARSLHLPRVIGFLLGGLALRGILHAALSSVENGLDGLEMAAHPLRTINDLALGLILFRIGGVFDRTRLKNTGARVLKIGVSESGCVALTVLAVCGVLIAFRQPDLGLGRNLTLAALLATAAIATAPAATLYVLREYDAKGPITDTILGVVGFNNAACIIIFNVLFLLLASAGVVDTHGSLSENLWWALASATLGSVVLGVLCGTLLSAVHTKLPPAEASLIFFATFIILGGAEKWLLAHAGLSYNFLLTALVTGGIFYNVAADSDRLETALRTVATPIFAGFFVMAGFNLHVGELAHLGWVGAGYVVARTAGKVLGAHIGVRWAKAGEQAGKDIGLALLCQAAVVIGLASFVEHNWDSDLARQFATVVLGSVVVFELAGPLLVKRCVKYGGEVKAITLLSRAGPATGGASVVALTIQALLRLLGVGKGAATVGTEGLKVRHIMRSNVQFMRASATLDDVLHFIERSSYDHFPVVDEHGSFAGVIHFSDVREVIYDPAMRELVTAIDLADPDSAFIPVEHPLDEALAVFADHNVGVLAVTAGSDDHRVVGVLEQRDVLRALHLSVVGKP